MWEDSSFLSPSNITSKLASQRAILFDSTQITWSSRIDSTIAIRHTNYKLAAAAAAAAAATLRRAGAIPIHLGRLARLVKLNLYRNQLAGRVPTELGLCTAMQSLYLGNNQLTGTYVWSVWRLLSSFSWSVMVESLLRRACASHYGPGAAHVRCFIIRL